ncbi:hypothetical protein [Pontibacillus sp. HMF3514]|uniref:hypothetical protein n=1 Tax=Pontibacillus sp. HMF3514 TaxID=2692425 RepID=UPI00131FB6AF|nr:hypothetical protein [Pontibacillus sp. HMF3514]QHE52625.1 hypothetical protein GS400_11535 [Pontibacillus sp. HMF3514]
MAKNYIDYTNKTVLSIPDHFINVKTGETQQVSKQVENQIRYHTNNNTLSHLIFTALNQYVQHNQFPTSNHSQGSNDILNELLEIKKLLRQGNFNSNSNQNNTTHHINNEDFALKELEDVLEAFSG